MPLTGQIGQVQPEHKAKSVRTIWSRVIRPGLQAGLDHFAPFILLTLFPVEHTSALYRAVV
jgi:hypothetical protein